jgi:hypothetical protein
MGDADPAASLAAFTSYEDYLDSQVGAVDKAYLEDPATRRALVELGYRGSGETLRRDEFEARKRAERDRHLFKDLAPVHLLGAGRDYAGRPLMAALAAREELVRSGKLSTIVFVRDVNARGQEVSGYIDFAQRLKTDAWAPLFSGAAKLAPRPTDLSFYNWSTGTAAANTTPNFTVVTDCGMAGVLFKVKRDRKVRGRRGAEAARRGAARAPRQGSAGTRSPSPTPSSPPPPPCPQIISVDPQKPPGHNTTRTEVPTTEVLQAAIFDHFQK